MIMKLWIARDKDGELCLYTEKPEKSDDIFIAPTEDTYIIFLKEDRYPEVTFENSPQQAELILSEEYNRLKEFEEICKMESDYGDKHYC